MGVDDVREREKYEGKGNLGRIKDIKEVVCVV
jgi:hypothetical protein